MDGFRSLPLLPALSLAVSLAIGPAAGAATNPPARFRLAAPRPATELIRTEGPARAREGQERVRFLGVGSPPEGDMPESLAFTPDGRIVLVANRDSANVSLFDVVARRWLATVPVAPLPSSVTVTPDGRLALVGHYGGSVVSAIDVATLAPLAAIPVTGGGPYRVEIAAGGRFAVAGMINDAVTSAFAVIDLEQRREVRSIPTPAQGVIGGFAVPSLGTFAFAFTQFRLSPTGDAVVLPVWAESRVAVYDLATGALRASVATPDAPWDVDVRSDGTLALVGHESFSSSGVVSVVDLVGGTLLGAFEVPLRPFFQRNRFLPDGHTALVTGEVELAGGALEGRAVWLDVADGEVLGEVPVGASVQDLAIAADGRRALLAAIDVGRVLDLESRSLAAVVPGLGLWRAAAARAGGAAAAVGTLFSEDLYVYDLGGSHPSLAAMGAVGEPPEGDAPKSVTLSPDGAFAAVGNQISNNIALVDLESGLLRALVPAGGRVVGVAYAPGGDAVVALAEQPPQLTVIDPGTGTAVAALRLPLAAGRQLLLSPDGRRAYAIGDAVAVAVDVDGPATAIAGQAQVPQAAGFSGYNLYEPSRGAALSSNGEILAVPGSLEDRVGLFHAPTLTPLASLDVCAFPYQSAISQDGLQVWVACGASHQVQGIRRLGNGWQTAGTLDVDSPYLLRFDAGGRHLYVSSQVPLLPSVQVIDTATLAEVARVPLSFRPEDMQLSGSTLWVAGLDLTGARPPSLVAVHAGGPASAVLEVVPLSGPPASLAVAAGGRVALAQTQLDGLDVVEGLASPCHEGAETACLAGGRFEVGVVWQDPRGGAGTGRVAPARSDGSGLFWFFREDNWELLVKVLDGCPVNGRYWVFSAAATHLGYTLRVIDRRAGRAVAYVHPPGRPAAALSDTGAFSTCP